MLLWRICRCREYPAGGTIVYYDPNSTQPFSPGFASEYSFECVDVQQPKTAFMFFHLFIVAASLIVLSMFVGSVAIAMTEVMSKMRYDRAMRRQAKMKQEEGEAGGCCGCCVLLIPLTC
jgi:uncharacterized membrane protein